jgi:signal peptidase II
MGPDLGHNRGMSRQGARMTVRVALIVAALATIGCDRVTKHVAATMLAGTPGQSYFANTVWVGYVENPGGFLSLGAGLPPIARTAFFTVATGIALVAVALLAVRRRSNALARLGLTLFLAGGASNWIDRIVRGSVVDFLNVGIGPVRTGIFNVADVAIMLGACIFVFAEFRRDALLTE